MSQSIPNPLFVPPATNFPLDGTENLIVLQGALVTQARLNDLIRAWVNNVAVLAPVPVTTNSYTLTAAGINRIFVKFNGAVSIALKVVYFVAGQDIVVADSGGFASPANPITITADAGVLFDGDPSGVVLNSPYGSVHLVYDGTNFIVVT